MTAKRRSAKVCLRILLAKIKTTLDVWVDRRPTGEGLDGMERDIKTAIRFARKEARESERRKIEKENVPAFARAKKRELCGRKMSNLCWNWAQHKKTTLDEGDRKQCEQLATEWDAIK